MTRNLDVALIRSFVTVAETSSMTAAANALHLTQGAVSQQIKRLEDALRLPAVRAQPARAGADQRWRTAARQGAAAAGAQRRDLGRSHDAGLHRRGQARHALRSRHDLPAADPEDLCAGISAGRRFAGLPDLALAGQGPGRRRNRSRDHRGAGRTVGRRMPGDRAPRLGRRQRRRSLFEASAAAVDHRRNLRLSPGHLRRLASRRRTPGGRCSPTAASRRSPRPC